MEIFGARKEPNYTYADIKDSTVEISTWREVSQGEIFLFLNFNTSSQEFSDIDTIRDLADESAPIELIQEALCNSISVNYYKCVSSEKDSDSYWWKILGHLMP